jgi:site-specific recombinase XerD
MMQLQLDQLINKVLEELKRLGMHQSTIKTYRYSAYSSIRNYCARHGTTYYDPATLDDFLSLQKKRFENREISKGYYGFLYRAVQVLKNVFHHGFLHWDHCSSGSAYKTNEYFNLCLSQFLESHKPHLSKGTIVKLKLYLLQFLNHIERNGHSDFSALSLTDVKSYLVIAAETHQGSMGDVLYALRRLLDYLKEHSLVFVDFDPVLYTSVKRRKRILPCFTHEEVYTILMQVDRETKLGKRDYAILLLASHTGLRAIDIANLRLKDLDWVNDTICIVQRKTGHSLMLPLEADTGNAIVAYILDARPESDSEHVFLRSMAPYRKLADMKTVGNILEKYRKKAGILRKPNDGKSFHALRRSMGTWMLESGVPLTTISQVLGHKHEESAKQYLSMDQQRLTFCALDFQGIPVERGLFL